MDADHIRNIPVALPPDYPFADHPQPSGDNPILFLGIDPATQTINFLRPHIAGGAAVPNGNIAIIGRTMTPLWGPVGGRGMRSGLVQYCDPGTWSLKGRIVLTGIQGVEYRVFVHMGTAPSPDPARPGIISEVTSLIGAGVRTCAGVLNQTVDTIDFDAYKFNCQFGIGKACEVSVWIYAVCDGPAGTVLNALGTDSTGQAAIPATLNSNCFAWRMNG